MSWNEEIKKELGFCGEQVFIGDNVFFADPKKVHLSDRVRIDRNTTITTALQVGSNVQICVGAMLGGGLDHTIKLGDWTFIGYGSKLFCGSEDYSGKFGPVNDYWGSNKVYHGDIEFEDYSGIASDVIVMPGVCLPEGCCIGAMSLVYDNNWKEVIKGEEMEMTLVHPLEPWNVYLGKPLQFHSERDQKIALEMLESVGFLKDRSNG